MSDEQLLRSLIEAAVESDQVDFKSSLDLGTKLGKAGLAKLVSALANSGGEDHDGWSFVVLGARKGQLIGGMDSLADDGFCAQIGRGVNAYLDPPVPFRVWAFKDPDEGWFGALAIPPRQAITGPHFIGKAFQDDSLSIRRGEVYVRVGEETRLAQRSDFERIYHERYALQFNRILDRQSQRDLPVLEVGGSSETLRDWHGEILRLPSETVDEVALPPDLASSIPELLDVPEIQDVPDESSLSEADESSAEGEDTSGVLLDLSDILSAASVADDERELAREWKRRACAYNQEVEKYVDDLGRYWRSYLADLDCFGRLFDVSVTITNTGRAPAENIDVRLSFPEVLQIYEKLPPGGLLRKPEPPTRPEKPTRESMISAGLANSLGRPFALDPLESSMARLMRTIPPPAYLPSPPPSREAWMERNTLHIFLDRLKHQRSCRAFGPYFMEVVGSDGEYEVEYEISADNMPEPVRGAFALVLSERTATKDILEQRRETLVKLSLPKHPRGV